MANASEALALWMQIAKERGLSRPPARSLTELRRDAAVAEELRQYMVALIPLDLRAPAAA
jgi:hypothetical protein